MKQYFKLFYWGYGATSGVWYWARRRLTLAGFCVVIACIITGAVGTDIENTVTYQSFVLLMGILLFAFASSFFFRARFSVQRILPRIGTVGLPLHYHVAVKNLTAKNQTGLTLLEDLSDPRPSFEDWLGFQLAEGRRVRPFRSAQRRRQHPFRVREIESGGNSTATSKWRGGSASGNPAFASGHLAF